MKETQSILSWRAVGHVPLLENRWRFILSRIRASCDTASDELRTSREFARTHCELQRKCLHYLFTFFFCAWQPNNLTFIVTIHFTVDREVNSSISSTTPECQCILYNVFIIHVSWREKKTCINACLHYGAHTCLLLDHMWIHYTSKWK